MILEGLKTERLTLRSLTTSDVKNLIPFYQDEEAMKFRKPITRPLEEEIGEAIQNQFNRYKADGYGLSALIHNETGDFIGQCGLLNQVVDDTQELEIGYHLMPAHWGQGYATEAAKACRDFAFEKKLADSVISIIDRKNINSKRVAARNGMAPTKFTTWRNIKVVIYRITREEWEALSEG